MEKDKVLSKTRNQHLWLYATIPYHYTTEADYINLGQKSLIYCLFHGTSSGKHHLQMIEPH